MSESPIAALERELTYEEAEAILRGLGGVSETEDVAVPIPPAVKEVRPGADKYDTSREPAFAPSDISLAPEMLRNLPEAVPDALVVIDQRGTIVLVNAQTEQLFGYPRSELLGRPIELLVPERYREHHVGQRNAYLQAPRVRPMGQSLELHGRRRDGREVPVEISLSPLPTAAGLLVVSTIRDISERKRSEFELRKLEARYRTLVEGIPAVTFMAALDGGTNELYVSPQIEELLGFSQREWLENPVLWYTQLHPDDRPRWHEEFARTCAGGQPFCSVYRFLSRDGRVVWVHGEAQIVRDREGRPLFLQGVAFDISAIKKAEEELLALNQTLEQRVAERTAVAEERAQALERSNQALERFAYVAVHDLREPLRTMKSYIQKVGEHYRGQAEARVEDWLTRSVNGADRMRAFMDSLFTYSRVRVDGKPPAPTDCAMALVAACDNLQAAIDDTGAIITADDLPTVLADATQLTQLLQNLLANALKFRADRQPHIHVSARPLGDAWEIAVSDNGIGIEPQYLQKIFGLGSEARLNSISRYPGSGIGLATCERIVKRHGGRIWAHSDGLDRGTTIRFTLPAVTPPAASRC